MKQITIYDLLPLLKKGLTSPPLNGDWKDSLIKIERKEEE